ncbi:AsmA family protein [Acetobacter sp. TBRC 12305]|uniref:AsmA family protein n=1 Tax=Acetobacter garciniae TaxID=2817435 RepID=A0A939KN26_9PROT|nr:AsmA family protein [Acetobacter garciniae]MBO1325928.1 AsmA family protein [Acetobacter garciniae]MBX0345828.1 AsmA family protein [Acetobacter garciniae]
MRVKWKIGLLAGAVVLALGGGSIVSATQEAGWLKTRLVDAIEVRTGRQASIGSLHVWLLPYPWVEARDVRLSGIAQDGVDMLAVGEVRARLALLPLFSHRIAFGDISVIAPKIVLRRFADGRADWHFTPRQADMQGTPGGNAPSGGMHWNLDISDVTIRQADLRWADAISRLSGTVALDKASAAGLDGTAPQFDIHGTKGRGGFGITGHTGPLMPPGSPLPVELRLSYTVDGHAAGLAHLDGVLKGAQGSGGAALRFGGSVGQLRDLNELFPHANLPDGQNISLDLAWADSADGAAAPQVQVLHVRTGKLDLGRWVPGATLANAAADAASPADGLALKLDGQMNGQPLALAGTLGTLGQVAAQLAAFVPMPGQQAGAATDGGAPQATLPVDLTLSQGGSSVQVHGGVSPTRTSLDGHGTLDHVAMGADLPVFTAMGVNGHVDIADTRRLVAHPDIPTALAVVNATADVQAQSVQWQGVDWTQLVSHVVVQNARVTFDPVTAQGNGTPQAGRMVYDLSGPTPQIALEAHSVFLPLAAIQGWFGLPPDMRGTVQFVGAISTQGATTPDRRANLTGHLGASVVNGSISGAFLKSLLGPQVPVKGSMPIRCFGTHMQFADDAAHIDLLGFESDIVRLSGHGTIAMGTQALDMHLAPQVLLGGASAASDIAVTGTLANPRPALEAGYGGGRYGITIGGNGAGGDENTCPALLSAAREGGAGPAAPEKKASKADKVMNLLHGLGLFR